MIPDSLNRVAIRITKIILAKELDNIKDSFPKVKLAHPDAFDPSVATELLLAYTHLSNVVEMIDDAESPERK